MTREEAIKKIRSQRDVICNGCSHAVGWCESHCGFSEAIDMAIEALRQPASSKAKPRSGHWIKYNTDDCPPVFKMFRICSECGCVKTEETKYCPNCGVYMEVDKNGTNR